MKTGRKGGMNELTRTMLTVSTASTAWMPDEVLTMSDFPPRLPPFPLVSLPRPPHLPQHLPPHPLVVLPAMTWK